jgi:hydroxypyruvate isomerase
MPKYSLCIEPVLPEVDFYDRIGIAAELGFDAIEFWEPAGRDITRIAHLAAQNRIAVSICCVKQAWVNSIDGDVQKMLAALRESVQIAKDLGCHALIGLSANASGDPAAQQMALTDNLKRAAEVVEREDVTLCLEALNTLVNHPGYFLNSSRVGFEILEAVDSPRVKLLFDIYHMQIMEGNIIANVTGNIARIGHFHAAGVPGRHELFNNELDYRSIIKAVDDSGYQEFFGLEYYPSYDQRQSLQDGISLLKK